MQPFRDPLSMVEWVNLIVLKRNFKKLYKSTLVWHYTEQYMWAWELMQPGSLWACLSQLTGFLIEFYPKAALWGHPFRTPESLLRRTLRREVQMERYPFGSKTGAVQWVFWCPIRHKLWMKRFAELGCLWQFSPWTPHLSLPLGGTRVVALSYFHNILRNWLSLRFCPITSLVGISVWDQNSL